MKKIYLLTTILALIFTVVAYQNCAKPVSFSGAQDLAGNGGTDTGGDDPVPYDPNKPPTDPDVPQDPDEDIIPTCQNTALSTKIIDVKFDSINDCKWGDSNLQNLGKKNGYMQARHEEIANISIPTGATICDMEFDFPEQNLEYDDHIILAFNDRILLNTGSDMHQYLNSDGSGYIYDWLKLKGKSQDVGGTSLYCNNGGLTCNVPRTETVGRILVDIPKSKIQQIMTMAPQSVHQIKMVTTGDDDVGDCNHTPLSFKVKVVYHQ